MYLITKEFHFSAAHSLPSLPPDHKCHRLHGHNYIITVGVERPCLDQHGMVVDFTNISLAVKPLVVRLDHTNLNELFDFPTTSENLARWFFDRLNLIGPTWVEVCETPTTKARFTR